MKNIRQKVGGLVRRLENGMEEPDKERPSETYGSYLWFWTDELHELHFTYPKE